MTNVRMGINGFGRIGRLVTRAAIKDGGVDIVGVNDITDAKTLAHLLKYDSVHGVYDGEIKTVEGGISIDGTVVPVCAERDPSDLPWGDLGVDLVLESTGIFANKEDMSKHVSAGAPKVLLSQPPKGDLDAIVVYGVNHDVLTSADQYVSNASCTTNCLAPMAKVLNDSFGLKRGLMATIHAYTNDQRILDLPHSDLRRARAAAANMIPTTTGAARAVGRVIADLDGKLDGYAMRVPVPDGSVTDLTSELEKDATVDEIKKAYRDLIRENHPDRLMAEGLPQEMIDVANEKVAHINDAYDRVEKLRGMK